MQETRFLQGALTVMPGSHLLGAVPHDLKLGKRDVPSAVFDREIRMVELERGDLLLFDSLLLHSGNLNMSDSMRYSIQARYTPAGQAVDPGMGGAVPVVRAQE
jgi:ectoine hydroxylase-related dioxygenase (phytanoyl-CoA dioxygenase family)